MDRRGHGLNMAMLETAVSSGPYKSSSSIVIFKPCRTQEELMDQRKHGSNMTMLEELLLGFDGDYHLDALALAVVNGNETVVRILAKASSKCKRNPYHVPSHFPNPKHFRTGDSTSLEENDAVDRSATGFEESGLSRQVGALEIRDHHNIWSITDKGLLELQQRGRLNFEVELQRYREDPAYNFLPVDRGDIFGAREQTQWCMWGNSGLLEYFKLDALYFRNGCYADYRFQKELEGANLHKSASLHYAAVHNFTYPNTILSPGEIQPDWNARCLMRKGIEEWSKLFWRFVAIVGFNIMQVAALSGRDSTLRALLKVDEVSLMLRGG